MAKATSPPRPTVYPSGPLDEFGQGRLPHASHSLGSTQTAILALSLSEFVLNRKPPGSLRDDGKTVTAPETPSGSPGPSFMTVSRLLIYRSSELSLLGIRSGVERLNCALAPCASPPSQAELDAESLANLRPSLGPEVSKSSPINLLFLNEFPPGNPTGETRILIDQNAIRKHHRTGGAQQFSVDTKASSSPTRLGPAGRQPTRKQHRTRRTESQGSCSVRGRSSLPGVTASSGAPSRRQDDPLS